MSTPSEQVPALARPVLADRQCEPRNDNPTARPQHQSAAKLPRAGTFTNSRLPRNASAGTLPRGRSYQGNRPLSAAAQAAQNGYFQRKAAKHYSERKRVRAEKEAREAAGDKPDASDELINITVDGNGVMIDGAKGSSAPSSGMGARTNSRSKMTRSSSRQHNGRVDDKENIAEESSQRAVDADIEAYFSQKRGTVEPRIPTRKKGSFTENAGSWDGSMPKRQGSRSFIENSRMRRESKGSTPAKGSAKEMPASEQSTVANTKTVAKDLETPRRQRNGKEKNQVGQLKPKLDEKDVSREQVVLSTPARDQRDKMPAEEKPSNSPTLSNVSDNTAGENSSNSSPTPAAKPEPAAKLRSDHQRSSLSLSDKSTDSTTSKAPLDGKWCDSCAGVGLHIAALLSQLEKHAIPEITAEPPVAFGETKKGWKKMLVGDSKSKSSVEKARMQQEIKVLRATVDFLYKKVESFEKNGGNSGPVANMQ